MGFGHFKVHVSWEPDRKPLVVPGCQPCGDIRAPANPTVVLLSVIPALGAFLPP